MKSAAALLILLLAPGARAQDKSAMMGSVVKSDRWRVIRRPQQIEELTGDVVYEKEGRRLRSDWALYNHDSEVLEAKGGIVLEQKTGENGVFEVRGASGRHERKTGEGRLDGPGEKPLLFTRKSAVGAPVGRGRAGHAAWNTRQERLYLHDDVYYYDEEGDMRAQKIAYDRREESIHLSGGRPVLTGRQKDWSAAVQADAITAYRRVPQGRRVVAEGRTRGWLYFPEAEKKAPFWKRFTP